MELFLQPLHVPLKELMEHRTVSFVLTVRITMVYQVNDQKILATTCRNLQNESAGERNSNIKNEQIGTTNNNKNFQTHVLSYKSLQRNETNQI